jgi:hypothetical protein
LSNAILDEAQVGHAKDLEGESEMMEGEESENEK